MSVLTIAAEGATVAVMTIQTEALRRAIEGVSKYRISQVTDAARIHCRSDVGALLPEA